MLIKAVRAIGPLEIEKLKLTKLRDPLGTSAYMFGSSRVRAAKIMRRVDTLTKKAYITRKQSISSTSNRTYGHITNDGWNVTISARQRKPCTV